MQTRGFHVLQTRGFHVLQTRGFCYSISVGGVEMAYYTRFIEKQIEEAIDTSGAVVVAGPKFCGKTTTCKLFAKSIYALDTKQKIELAQSSPRSILDGDVPRLIDEWQNVPDLWNCARTEVDEREEKFGQFIFTGSSTPADKKDIYHSGAGRIVTLEMRPMTLYESHDSTGEISLRDLFDNKNYKAFDTNDEYRLQDTAFYICRGGWPLSIISDKEKALKITKNYYSTLFNFENNKNKKFRNKKKSTFITVLKSYARNISTEARRGLMLQDICEHEDRNMDSDTFDEYLEALNDLYIIRDIDAWNPNLRSKTSIITTPTRHFVDTSIAAGALNISPNDLINDPKTFGLFFEDFAVKELSVYVQNLNGELRHYRDSNGLECDAVIHLEDGRYALIEIKLGGEDSVAFGMSTLKTLQKKLDNIGNGPAFLMILTACGSAYTTKEGIHVVPINLLRD